MDCGSNERGKEKDMDGCFWYENKIFDIAGKIVDCFYASVLWLVFSLPIVTFGASSTAFYYTIHKSVRGGRGYIWRSFWGAFRANWKQMTKIWLVMAAVFAFLFTDYRIMSQAVKQGRPFGGFCFAFLILMLFAAVWCIYIFAYAARFEGGWKATMKNAAILALLHLPWSILALGLLLASMLVVYLLPPSVLVVPAAVGCIYDLFLEKIFRKYMSQEDLERERQL